jgi:hypothetical protein
LIYFVRTIPLKLYEIEICKKNRNEVDVMKKILVKCEAVLPHLLIILSIMFLTFTILDYYNPTMKFLNSEISKIVMFIFIGVAFLNAIALSHRQRDEKN